jgi:hypothetical protein
MHIHNYTGKKFDIVWEIQRSNIVSINVVPQGRPKLKIVMMQTGRLCNEQI